MVRDSDTSPSQDLEAPLLTARKLLDWRRSLGRPAVLPPLDGVILTHQGALFRALAPRWCARRYRGLSAELRALPGSSGRLAIANPGVGGPATAVLVEELAVLGVRRIVAIDIAATLMPGLTSGCVVLADSAFIGDGTSPHYAPSAASVRADTSLLTSLQAALRAGGIDCTAGAVWSTDAPLRETASAVAAYGDKGAVLVDMETAALYAAGAALDVATAAALVVADQLADGWLPPADLGAIQAQLRRVTAATRKALQT